MDQLEQFEIGTLTEEAIAKINEMTADELQELSSFQGTLLIEDTRNGNKGQATYGSLATLKRLGHEFYKAIGFYKPNEPAKEINAPIVGILDDEIIAPTTDLFTEQKKTRKTRETKIKTDGDIIQ